MADPLAETYTARRVVKCLRGPCNRRGHRLACGWARHKRRETPRPRGRRCSQRDCRWGKNLFRDNLHRSARDASAMAKLSCFRRDRRFHHQLHGRTQRQRVTAHLKPCVFQSSGLRGNLRRNASHVTPPGAPPSAALRTTASSPLCWFCAPRARDKVLDVHFWAGDSHTQLERKMKRKRPVDAAAVDPVAVAADGAIR